MKVLIVEDDHAVVDLLQLYFGGKGYQTDIARDGMQALEKFPAGHYDLVILDIMLPQLDGWSSMMSRITRS